MKTSTWLRWRQTRKLHEKQVTSIPSRALPTMDYRGQKLSENIYYFLTILFGVSTKWTSSEELSAQSELHFITMRLQPWLIIALVCSFQGIAWIAGYIQGDFTITVYGWFIGLAISLVVSDVILRIPHRNKNFDILKWLYLNSSSSWQQFLSSFAFQTGRCTIETKLLG